MKGKDPDWMGGERKRREGIGWGLLWLRLNVLGVLGYQFRCGFFYCSFVFRGKVKRRVAVECVFRDPVNE